MSQPVNLLLVTCLLFLETHNEGAIALCVYVSDLVQAPRSLGLTEHSEDSHIRAAHRQLAPSDDALALAS